MDALVLEYRRAVDEWLVSRLHAGTQARYAAARHAFNAWLVARHIPLDTLTDDQRGGRRRG